MKKTIKSEFRCSDASERGPKPIKGLEHSVRVLRRCFDPYITVSCEPEFRVFYDRVRTDDQISNFVLVENGQYLFEVWTH